MIRLALNLPGIIYGYIYTALVLLPAVRCLFGVFSVLLLASGINSYVHWTYTTMTRITTDCYQGFTYTLRLLSNVGKM